MPRSFRAIDVLVYDGCIAAEAFAVADTLHMANTLATRQGMAPIAVSVVAIAGGNPRASCGAAISARRPSAAADMLVVPGMSFVAGDDLLATIRHLDAEKALVARTTRSGRMVASTCVGSFLLAEAGVLEGRRATTAWIAAGLFSRRYPGVILDIDRLLVRDGPVWTTAAVTAAWDLALELVREHFGHALASLIAKVMLKDTDRTLQTPYVMADLGIGGHSDLVTRACHLLRRQVSAPFDLRALADACRTSTRTLSRRFRQDLGVSPLQFSHKVKIERAKSLLETTRMRIAELPGRVGYTDETTFRQLFVRATGLTPTRYRERFRRSVSALG